MAKSLPVVDYSYLLDLFTGVLLAADNFQHTDTGQYNSGLLIASTQSSACFLTLAMNQFMTCLVSLR